MFNKHKRNCSIETQGYLGEPTLFLANEVRLDLGDDTSIDAGNPVAERVHATLFGISVFHVLELDFAALELLFKVVADGTADFDQHFFGVLALLQHAPGGG